MISIDRRIAIDEDELSFRFVRSPGPGGQNVNKVATAVQLCFDLRRSPNLPPDVKERAIALAGRRISSEGVLMITARRHRTRERNRQDALARLVDLLRRALIAPKKRVPSRPTQASRADRLVAKRKTSEKKRGRGAGRTREDEGWDDGE